MGGTTLVSLNNEGGEIRKKCVSPSNFFESIQNGTNCCFSIIVLRYYKSWQDGKQSVEVNNGVFDKLIATLTFSQNGEPNVLL